MKIKKPRQQGTRNVAGQTPAEEKAEIAAKPKRVRQGVVTATPQGKRPSPPLRVPGEVQPQRRPDLDKKIAKATKGKKGTRA